MHMHPTDFLWIHEQESERQMTQRALERAARSGGEQRPGQARGGIAAFVRKLRRVAGAAADLRFGRPSVPGRPTGAQGA